jgi:hypothetical protein
VESIDIAVRQHDPEQRGRFMDRVLGLLHCPEFRRQWLHDWTQAMDAHAVNLDTTVISQQRTTCNAEPRQNCCSACGRLKPNGEFHTASAHHAAQSDD